MTRKKFSLQPYQKKIRKPWGYEMILTAPDSPVTGKILYLANGKRFSLQYHDQKEEILTLFRGKAQILLENQAGNLKKIPMKKQKGYHIKPFQKHRCQGVKNGFILEVSTPEKGNTVRLDDDYRRPTETEAMRKLPNRGWQKEKTAHDQKK